MTDQLSPRAHHHSPDPLRNHGYTDVCSCGVRIHRDADGTWAPDNPSTGATCETCPWWDSSSKDARRDCRVGRPEMHPYEAHLEGYPDHGSGLWPRTLPDDWCGEHPDRQPHLECATTTLVTRESFPTAGDMRRIIDALERMASRAARVKP